MVKCIRMRVNKQSFRVYTYHNRVAEPVMVVNQTVESTWYHTLVHYSPTSSLYSSLLFRSPYIPTSSFQTTRGKQKEEEKKRTKKRTEERERERERERESNKVTHPLSLTNRAYRARVS